MKKISFILSLLFFSVVSFAQNVVAETEASRAATGLRADGKIYVVTVVLLTILLGLFIYLIRLDRKISRMEKGGLPK